MEAEVACEYSHLSSPLSTRKVSFSYRSAKRHQRTSVGKGDDKAVFAAYLGNCKYKYSCLRSELRKIFISVSEDAPSVYNSCNAGQTEFELKTSQTSGSWAWKHSRNNDTAAYIF